MRLIGWSSDVCFSYLAGLLGKRSADVYQRRAEGERVRGGNAAGGARHDGRTPRLTLSIANAIAVVASSRPRSCLIVRSRSLHSAGAFEGYAMTDSTDSRTAAPWQDRTRVAWGKCGYDR